MKRKLLSILIGVTLCSMVATAADNVVLEGVTPGKWTMDFEAAKKVAKEKQLPILLDFSGSDWCGWCKLMEEKVFSKPEWTAYAKENLVLVLLDFPNDKSLVPEKYQKRNRELATKYKVEGYPTFIVLDDDAATELGRMGAGRDKTPASFIEELKPMFQYRAASVKKYVSKLKPDEAKKYMELVKQITKCEGTIKQCNQQIASAQAELAATGQKLDGLKAQAQEFRATQLGPEKLKEYQQLQAELKKAEDAFTAWIQTKPQRSQENMKKYQELTGTIQEIMGKLSKY